MSTIHFKEQTVKFGDISPGTTFAVNRGNGKYGLVHKVNEFYATYILETSSASDSGRSQCYNAVDLTTGVFIHLEDVAPVRRIERQEITLE